MRSLSVLKTIIEYTEKRVEMERKWLTLPKRKRRTIPFRDIFRECCALIAEFKQESPSGVSAKWREPLNYLTTLHRVASAFSVLTEPRFFKGSYKYLETFSRISSKPILMKDFIIDPFQIEIGYAYGADAVLIIAKALREEEVDYLARYALSKGLTPLIEVVSIEEAEIYSSKPYEKVIGVNSRDLDTLQIDVEKLREIREFIKGFAIAESGIKSKKEAYKVGSWGYEAMLVGTSLMESDDPRALALELKQTCCLGLREGHSSHSQR